MMLAREVSMAGAEAALYGELVKYLCGRWAEEIALAKGGSIASEQLRIQELVREWFFTPQETLRGLTPRDIIRNEAAGRPNLLGHNHSLEEMAEDCPLCQRLQRGESGAWEFHPPTAMTLLDLYDPEGREASLAEMAWRQAAREQRATLPEARLWLSQPDVPVRLAPDRFSDNAEALEFVEYLYSLGAVTVRVDWNHIGDKGYAPRLIVELPSDVAARYRLYELLEDELAERQNLDLEPYIESETLIFSWE